MSRNPGIGGREYLDRRGDRYAVRVQVPLDVRHIIGRTELKKSLGKSFDKIAYHRHVDDFLGRIAAARQSPPDAVMRAEVTSAVPSHADIDAACYAYFRRMVTAMRRKVAHPVGDNPASSESRGKGYMDMISNHISVFDNEAWSTMSAYAVWLCDEQGWRIDPEAPQYQYLCEMLVRARLQCFKDELRKLEGKMSVDPDADPMFGAQPPKSASTLGGLVERFKEVKGKNWSLSTRQNYVIIFRVLTDICGHDTPLSEIDEDYCLNVQSLLSKLPANYQKRPATKGCTVRDAIRIGEAKGLKLISPATINSHLTKLGAIIRYGRDKGLIVGHPMANVKEFDPVHPSEKRHSFTTSQLTTIFGSEPWARGPGGSADRPSRYWAPLIAIFSGGRLTDICGQKVDEMIVEDGVRLFYFQHRPGDRHVKSGQSRRVPVHPTLVALGFWDFVEEARTAKRENLFPDVSRDKNGKWGDGTSDWFSRTIDKLEMKGRNLSFHSFRHSFEDALRRVDLHNTPISSAITGRWTPGVAKNYGTAYSAQKLEEAMIKVDYPGLQIAHLHRATSIYDISD